MVAAHRVENDFSRQTGFILRLISHRRLLLSRARFVLPAPLRGSCSTHTSGRRDVAGEAPDNLDRGLSAVPAAHRVRGVFRGELLNVVS